MNNKSVLLLLCFLVSFVSCNTAQTSESDTRDGISEKNDLVFDPCIAYKAIDSNLQDICNNASSYVKNQPDDCVLSLLDTISKRALSERNDRYLKALEAICEISDGYVSEYLMEVAEAQFYNNFDNLISFCSSEDRCLSHYIIEGLSMKASMSIDPDSEKNNIEIFIQQQVNKSNYTKEMVLYLEQLAKSIDPNMFD